ncbi:MAG: ISNCY family transposase [Acidobacteriota bacterium]
MIEPRYRQQTLYEQALVGFMPDYKKVLWEPWMLKVDEVLENDKLVEIVHKALQQRHPQSGTRGRKATPAETVLRLLVLKHLKNWSYETLEKEVRPNLVYREFTRIGGETVPDAKTMVRWGTALGPKVIRQIHEKVVEASQQTRVVQGSKLRVDTTVVETNIRYPTDSGLLGDGVRVLTRTMKRIEQEAGKVGTRLRSRVRSVKHRLIEISRAAKGRGQQAQEKIERGYQKLMETTRQVVRQAKTFVEEVASGIKQATTPLGDIRLKVWAEQLKHFSQLTERVLEQTKARVIEGNTHFKEKLLSLFEEHTEAIRKGKAAKPTEFGKMVKIQEAEHQIITDYEVFEKRPIDADLLLPSIETHENLLDRLPRLVAADAGFFSADNQTKAQEKGVEKLAVPNKKTRSKAQWANQRQRWFRRAQRWRVGCEGRISVLKRKHGLLRCRYHGMAGMERWVGLGAIANNLIQIGKRLAQKPAQA